VTDQSEGIAKRLPRRLAREDENEEERLLNLFRNRAELKKAFSDLQKSLRLAEEKLASQEAATRRAEERFQAIEQLLAQPGTGYTALVYFQLRALWRVCHDRLQAVSDELRGRHEERQRREELMRFNQEKQRQLAGLDQQLMQARDEVEQRLSRRNEIRAELEGAKGLWAYARRRKLNELLQQRRVELEASRLRLLELQDRRAAVNAEPWPEFSGLDIATKREINLMIIAAAQELYLHFSTGELARKARDASVNAIQEMRYGSEEECKALIGTVREAVASLGPGRPRSADIEARSLAIARQAQFRSARETVPMAASVARIELPVRTSPASPVRRIPLEVNVLADEYWDIYDVLIP
jgi:DNA repair exonuclease SbcCD ATPase subunit